MSTDRYDTEGLVVIGPQVVSNEARDELVLTVERDVAPGVRAVVSFRSVDGESVVIDEIRLTALAPGSQVTRTNLHDVPITAARRAAIAAISAATGDEDLALTAYQGGVGAQPIDDLTLLQHVEAFVAASERNPNNPYREMPVADFFANARWTWLARNRGLLTPHPRRQLTDRARELQSARDSPQDDALRGC